jgi:hypothetical protein
MAWSFVLTPGGDISAYVDVMSITRTQRLHSALKPNSNKLDFRLAFDATLFQNLIATDDIQITVLDGGSPYFAGYLSPNYKTSIRDGRKFINVTAEDYTLQLLGKTIGSPQAWAGFSVCNPASPSTSLVHAIATLAGVSVGSGATIATTVPYVVVLADEKQTWAKLLESILFEYGHVYYFSEAGNLIVIPAVNASTVTTTGTLTAGTNIRGEMEIEKDAEKYDDIRIKYDLVELKTGIKLFQDTSGATDASAAIIPLAATGDANGKDYYPLTSKIGEVFSSWKSPDGYDIWIATTAAITATYETGITVHQALANYYKKCSFAYKNTSGAIKNITKLEITGNAYVIKSKNTARSSIVSGKNLFEHEAKYIFDDTSAANLAKLISQYYKYSDLKYKIKSNTVFTIGEYVLVTDAVYSGISAKARVVGIVKSSSRDTYTYDLEAVADYSAVTIDTQGETAPAPSVPVYSDTSYYNNTPPTNNVTNLAISSTDNPNGTADVTFSWDYTQGDSFADGFLVFARREITTPDPINLNTDYNLFVSAGSATSYATTINFPARQAGAGSLPVHYRFGVIAMATRRAGTVTHTGGIVELAGWIDKTFASVILIDAGNYWDQNTGELKVTVATEKYLLLDPANAEASLNNLPIRSYEGQGVNRRAIQIDNEALDWINTPDTSPASPELLVARIGRLGVGSDKILMDGDFLTEKISPEWSDKIQVGTVLGDFVSYLEQSDGTIRIAYVRDSDLYLVERVLSGSTWGSEVVINNSNTLYSKYVQFPDGQVRISYQVNPSPDILYERILSGSTWGTASSLTGSNATSPAYVVLKDGTVRFMYTSGGWVYWRIWSGASWGTADYVYSSYTCDYLNAICQDNGNIRISFRKSSDNKIYERIYSGSWSSETNVSTESVISPPSYIELVNGDLSIVYRRSSDGYVMQSYFSGSTWGSPSPIVSESVRNPAIMQMNEGSLRLAYSLAADGKIYERILERYQSIADPKIIRAEYYISTAQTFTAATYTIVDFNEKVEDTHNAVTLGSGWLFNCPADGVYEVKASVATAIMAHTAGNIYLMNAYNARSNVTRSIFRQNIQYGYTQEHYFQGSTTFRCLKDDDLSVRLAVYGTGMTTQASAGNCWVQITRIGA